MKPLRFEFYRRSDCLAPDGRSLDFEKIGSLAPVSFIKAKPELVLREHLDHLAFSISRAMPHLEGERVEVKLAFRGPEREPKLLSLIALHGDQEVASRLVPLRTLDVKPFLLAVLKRHPDLEETDLVFTLNQDEE